MYRTMLFIVGWLTALNLVALSSGDLAVKLEKVSAVKGKVPLLTPYVQDDRNSSKLKLLTIGNVWSDNTRGAMPIIAEAAKQHSSTLLLGNPSRDVVKFIDEFPVFDGSIVADPEGKMSGTFLGESIILPRTYAIDYQGRIIWDGETAELPQFIKDFSSDSFDSDKQQKFSKLQLQLEKSMRAGNDAESASISSKALKIYPAHPAILRMRLYMLTSTNRERAAWELLEEQSKLKSNSAVELMKLGLTFSNRELAPNATPTLQALSQTEVSMAEWLNAVWGALTIHQFDSAMLDYLKSMPLPAKNAVRPAAGTKELELFHAVNALLLYRQGKIAEAVNEQQKALAVKSNPEMERLLSFYQKALALSKS